MNTAATLSDTSQRDAASGSLHGGYGALWWETTDDGYRCRIDVGDATYTLDSRLAGERVDLTLSPEPPDDPAGSNLEAASLAWLEWLLAQHPGVHRLVFHHTAPPGRHGSGSDLLRSEFFQQTVPWYRGDNGGSFPLTWTETAGVRHPVRPPLPDRELYRRHIDTLGMEFSLRRLRKDLDLDRLTRWMNDPRVAVFWEHAWPREEQAAYIDRILADAHLQPVIACFDDVPFGYFELYWALEDRLGPYYDAQPFDRGMHLLVGEPEFLGRRYTDAWLQSLCHFLFLDDDRTERLVGEPQADNTAMLKYLGRAPGWHRMKEFHFPHKHAELVMCHRVDFFEQAHFG